MTCDGCGVAIEDTPLLVPKFPTGAYRYHTSRACRATASRRAALAFPNISGKRGSRTRRTQRGRLA